MNGNPVEETIEEVAPNPVDIAQISDAAHAAGEAENALTLGDLRDSLTRIANSFEAHLIDHIQMNHSHEHDHAIDANSHTHEPDSRMMALSDAIKEIEEEDRPPDGQRRSWLYRNLRGNQ